MFNVCKFSACLAARAVFQNTFLIAFLLLLPLAAQAAPTTISASNPIGATATISLSWSDSLPCCGHDGQFMRLEEKVNGSWVTRQYGTGTSYSSSGRSIGTYEFRLKRSYWYWYEYCDWEFIGGCEYWEQTTSTVTEDSKLVYVIAPKPGTPTESQANNTVTSFTVHWSPTYAGGTYQLQRQDASYGGSYGNWSTKYSGSAAFWGQPSLANGHYRYRVRSCTGPACTSWSNNLSVTVLRKPGTPGTPSISGQSGHNFTITWGKPGSNPRVTYYQVYRQTAAYGSGSYGGWSFLTNVNVSSSQYNNPPSTSSLSHTESNGHYKYKIRACNESGCSDSFSSDSPAVTIGVPPAVPGTPSDNQSGQTDTIFNISWPSVSGASSYQVQKNTAPYSGGSYGGFVTWRTVAGNSTANDATADGRYQYRVRSCNEVCSGWSNPSAEVAIRNIPGAPTGMSTDQVSETDTIYTLTWTGPSSGEATYYDVERDYAVYGGSFQNSWADVTSPAPIGLSLVDTQTTDGYYRYRAKACNESGCSTSWSPTTQANIRLTPPSPNSIAGSPNPSFGNISLAVSWNTSYGVINGWKLEQRKKDTGTSTWGGWTTEVSDSNYGGGNPSTIPVNRSTGASGTDFQFRISACYSSTRCSAPSPTSSLVQVNPPGTPQDIWFESLHSTNPDVDDDGVYTVKWTDIGLQEGLSEVTYSLEQSRDGVTNWAGISLTAATDTEKSITITEAPGNEGDYYYRVTACYDPDSTGPLDPSCGDTYDPPESIEVAFAPGAVGIPSVTSSISSIYANSSNDGVINLSWNAPSSWNSPSADTVTKYIIERLDKSDVENEFEEVASVTSGTSKQLSGQPEGEFDYRIIACNGPDGDICGVPGSARAASIYYPPSSPGSITGPSYSDGTGSFSLGWGGATGTVTRYEIDQNSAGYQTNGLLTNKSYNSLSDGNYSYQVRACNTLGCGQATAAKVVGVYNAPGQPLNVSGPTTARGDNYEIDWAAPATGTATAYRLYEKVSTGSYQLIDTIIAPVTSATVSGRSGGNYSYKLTACNGPGVDPDLNCGVDSAEVQVAILDVADPQAPSLAASQITSTEITAMDEVGSISGSFRVDESGSATYSIPIFTIPGTAGVTPEVSLNYSSNGGNGLVGLGWSIGGLSSITRCRQTLGQDGASLPIQWDDNDVFCLDGQRLILTNGPTYSYGEPGSTYRTEIDSFATVTAVGGSAGDPFYFEVHGKDGSIAYYGNSTDSILEKSGSTLVWAINEFQDNVENAIKYVYTNDSNGQRIDHIAYAYGGTSASNASIDFTYVLTRDDPQVSYVAGEEVVNKALLTDVSVSNKANSSWHTLRNYDLSYETSADDELSRLYEIEECVGSSCLPVTSFTWSTAGIDFSAQNQESLTGYSSQENHSLADIDGDGFMDVVFIDNNHNLRVVYTSLDSNGEYDFTHTTGVSTGVNSYGLQVFDYNGDGRQDVAVYCQYGGSCTTGWKVHLSEPQAGGGWRLASSGIHIGFGASTVFADLNGDGLADAINGDSYQKLQRNTSDGTNTPYSFVGGGDIHLSPYMDDLDEYDVYEITDIWGIGDFNGDGRMDLAGNIYMIDCEDVSGTLYCDDDVGDGSGVGTDYDFVVLNQGSTFEEASGVGTIDEGVVIADFNADGLSDLLIPGASDYTLKLSKGDGSFVSLGSIGANVTEGVRVVDYNGDGYTDVYWTANSYLNYKLWDPSATTPGLGSTQQVSDGTNPISTSSSTGFNYYLVDVNSDARPDMFNVLVPSGTGTRTLAIRKNDGFNQPRNVITEIENGLGAITVVNYEPLSQTDHYSRIEGITSGSTTVEVCWDEQQTWYGETYTYEVCENQTVAAANSSAFYTAMTSPFSGNSDSLSPQSSGPVLELMGPMYVVTSVSSSAPANGNAGAFSDISYIYEQAKVQAAGRGVLGFKALTTVDGQTGIKTRTEYRQDWPYIGLPVKTTVSLDGDLISEATNTWSVRTRSSVFSSSGTSWATSVAGHDSATIGPVAPYIALSVEKTYDPYDTNNLVLSSVITQNGYDGYGNPTDITVSTYEGEETNPTAGDYELRVDTDNVYGGAGGGAEKGRLSQTTVTTTRDSVQHVAKSQFEYYSSNQTVTLPGSYSSLGTYRGFTGMLQYEKVLNSSNATVLTKQHYYDQYGNEVLTRTNADGLNRYSPFVEYDSTGRFVDTTYELFTNNPNTPYSTVAVATSDVTARNNYGMATTIVKTVDATNDESITIQRFISPRGTVYQETDSTGQWTATNAIDGAGSNCIAGTAYRIRTRSAGGSEAYECFDVLGRSIHKEVLRFDDTQDTWAETDTVYDSLGRVLKVSEPYSGSAPATWAWTVNQYDELGRVTQVSEPSNGSPRATTFVYDGLETTQTSPRGNTRREVRNVLGEVVAVYENVDATSVGGSAPGVNEESQATYEYNPRGDLIKLTDAASNITTMVYDEFGRKTSMTDPDKGNWTYAYNNFGEQVCQQDAKDQVIWNVYDFAGRMVERKDFAAISSYSCSASTAPSATEVGITQWEYDKTEYGLGQLDAVVTASNTADLSTPNYAKTIEFDQYGRLSSTVTDIEGLTDLNAEKTTYDQYGRVFQVFDAARNSETYYGNGTQNHYNDHGYLDKVTSAEHLSSAPWQTYYEIGDMDLRGNVIDATYGDVVEMNSSYEADTGYLSWLSASDGTGMIGGMYQNYDLDWDVAGNLISRRNVNSTTGGSGSSHTNQDESFTYDAMNRLASYTVGSSTTTVAYNNIGNITAKSDWATTYTYGTKPSSTCSQSGMVTPGPHAVSVANYEYCYDANGNMVKDSSGRELTYSVYDMVTQITKGGDSTTFAYGPDRGRYMRTDTDGTNTTTTYYIGSVQKVDNDDGTLEWKRDIGVGQITQVVNSSGVIQSEKTDYFLKDHLGSITHIIHTNTSGAVTSVDEYAFDPWGKRRDGSDWTDALTTLAELQSFHMTQNGLTGSFTTTKGFTGHEMIDEMGIIHMNGRIYDPNLGRFLQADPHIQEPYLTASLNRYSYVWNNPLNATDPSGYFVSLIVGVVAALGGSAPLHIGVAVGIAAFAESAAAHGGDLVRAFGDALVAGVSAGTFASWGSQVNFANVGWSDIGTHALAYGTLGGITSMLQGGKFGNGFVSAGLVPYTGKLLTGTKIGSSLGIIGRTLIQMVISGTISEKTGGKFANGAGFAAFSAIATAGVQSLRNPTAEEVTMARIEQDVYDPQGGLIDGYGLREFETDPKTGLQYGLYVNGETGHSVLAFAGTNDLVDWKANIAQAFGVESKQYSQAISLGQRYFRATGGNITFVGHSLGGGLAIASATITGGRAIVFNPADVHSNTVGGISPLPGSITSLHSTYDVLQISNGITLGKVGGEQVSLGAAGWHPMNSICRVVGC